MFLTETGGHTAAQPIQSARRDPDLLPWLMEHFGFTLTEAAEILGLSEEEAARQGEFPADMRP